MQMKKQNILRQGEVLLTRIAKSALPQGLKVKDNVLAYGEVTGHHHRLDNQAQVLTDGNVQYVVVDSAESVLQHEEHKPVTVPQGAYKVTIQREYDILRDEVRSVQD
jgi:predicted O-methyltransferase YrrM